MTPSTPTVTYHNSDRLQNLTRNTVISPGSPCSPHSQEKYKKWHSILQAYELDPYGNGWRELSNSYGIEPGTYYRWVKEGMSTYKR